MGFFGWARVVGVQITNVLILHSDEVPGASVLYYHFALHSPARMIPDTGCYATIVGPRARGWMKTAGMNEPLLPSVLLSAGSGL